MRFVFRADASNEIGAGHVMRISVLAEEAINQGFESIFIGRIKDLNWVENRISGLGFLEIHKDFTSFVSDPNEDILVMDSYLVPVDMDEIQTIRWACVVVIADNLTPNYAANLIIKPSLISNIQQRDQLTLLEGPEFILIRKSLQISNGFKDQKKPLKIVISGGGTDIQNFAKSIATELDKIDYCIEAHFFTSMKIESSSGKLFINHNIGENIDIISRNADLAFTTASTSAFEFLARRVPIGVVCAIDNQKEYYKQLGEYGYAIQIGDFTDKRNTKLKSEEIRNLITQKNTRNDLKRRSANLIDTNGSYRILLVIKEIFLKR